MRKIIPLLVLVIVTMTGCKATEKGGPMFDGLPGGVVMSVWADGSHQLCVQDMAHPNTTEVCRDISGAVKKALAARGITKGKCYPGDAKKLGDALGHNTANCKRKK